MATKTRETLEERAARATAELAALDAEQQRLNQVEAERLAEHQADFDAAVVAEYDRPALDADVATAQQALQQAIAEDPLTKALTGYYLAASRRREVTDQYLAALARAGRDVSGAQRPRADDIGVRDVHDAIERTAKTAASDWRVAAESEFHARRDNPDTEESTK